MRDYVQPEVVRNWPEAYSPANGNLKVDNHEHRSKGSAQKVGGHYKRWAR